MAYPTDLPNFLFYDCEIVNGILGRNEARLEGVTYCEGWRDFAGMGLSVVGALCGRAGPRVFLQDNLADLQTAIDQADILVSFNGLQFDNHLLAANGITIDPAKCYDLLAEQWHAAGLSREYAGPTHDGFGLDATCKANYGEGKSGHGALAPIQWQRGQYGAVIDYCLRDVFLTAILMDRILETDGQLVDPRDPSQTLQLQLPNCLLPPA